MPTLYAPRTMLSALTEMPRYEGSVLPGSGGVGGDAVRYCPGMQDAASASRSHSTTTSVLLSEAASATACMRVSSCSTLEDSSSTRVLVGLKPRVGTNTGA